MRIEKATRLDIRYVALQMRDSDYAEFSALYPAEDRTALAEQIAARFEGRTDVIVALSEGEPVAIGAPIETRPNVITLLFFATDKLPEIGGALTRFILQRLFPPLIEAGVHRIEAVSLDGHTEAHRWIEALGLKQEGSPMLGYGKNKETYLQFAWVREDVSTAGA